MADFENFTSTEGRRAAKRSVKPSSTPKPKPSKPRDQQIEPRRRTQRQCTTDNEVLKILELASKAAHPTRKNTLLINLNEVWVPTDDLMLFLKKFSFINSGLFCSVLGFEVSNEDGMSMLGCKPFTEPILDAYSHILSVAVLKYSGGTDDHCIFLPMELGLEIMKNDPRRLAAAFVSEQMRSDKGTMQIFSPISFPATSCSQQRYALVCMDLLENNVNIFDPCERIPLFYADIMQAYIEFADNNVAYPDNGSYVWRPRYYNYLTRSLPMIDEEHSGALVCVLMDIFCSSREMLYDKVHLYVNNDNMMNIRALLYYFMQGFNYKHLANDAEQC